MTHKNYYFYIRFTAFFQDNLVGRHQKGKPFWILLEQETIGWQWHQVDHMQIICTSLQTDNHASTSPLSFYRPGALPANQPTSSKHWRHALRLAKNCDNGIAIRFHVVQKFPLQSQVNSSTFSRLSRTGVILKYFQGLEITNSTTFMPSVFFSVCSSTQ